MSLNGTAGNLSPTKDDYGFRVTKIILYFFILICSTFGNAIVVYIICSFGKMRTASNFLILNLAISDLLTPLISIPFDFALEENGYEWIYDGFACKLLWPCQTFFSTISSLTLAGIALDRYRIIMHPFTTRLTSRQILLMLLAIYVFSGIAICPYVHFLRLENGECGEQWPAPPYKQSFTVFLFLIQYALPLVFMIVMYSLAMRNLCETRSKMRSCSISSSEKRRTNANSGFRGRVATLRRRMTVNSWDNPNAKATKMFIIVVAVFAIFMFPNQAVWLWAAFGAGEDKPFFNNLSIVSWLFTYTNSVVNPLIFRTFSKDFRSGFKVVRGQMCRVCCHGAGQMERARRYLEGKSTSVINGNSAAGSSAQIELNSEVANGKIAARHSLNDCDIERRKVESTAWLDYGTDALFQINETTHFVKNTSTSPAAVSYPGENYNNTTRCEPPSRQENFKEHVIDALVMTKESPQLCRLLFGNEDIFTCIERSRETCC